MIRHVELGPEVAPVIAAFTRVAGEFDLLSTASIRRSIFSDPDPQLVLGVYNGGLEAVGVAVVRRPHGYVKYLAVHPAARGRGVGTVLLRHLERFCAEQGATSVEVGTSAPYYVTPGLDVRYTEALCFLEASGYTRAGDAVNLSAPLRDLEEPSLDVRPAVAEDIVRLRPWVEQTNPLWVNELERAVHMGTCVVQTDRGFACWDVNREGWFGPMATHPDHRRKGIGRSVLLAALHRMHANGHERAEIAWAGAFPFYVHTVGARISRVFWAYRKGL